MKNIIVGLNKSAEEIAKETEEIIKEVCPMPDHVIIFGMTNNNFPVLFDLEENDKVVVYENTVGQGRLILKLVAQTSLLRKLPFAFLVFSNDEFMESPNVAIVSFDGKMSTESKNKISSWRELGFLGIVYVDGIENIGESEFSKSIESMIKNSKGNIVASVKEYGDLDEFGDCFTTYITGERINNLFEMRDGTKFHTPL